MRRWFLRWLGGATAEQFESVRREVVRLNVRLDLEKQGRASTDDVVAAMQDSLTRLSAILSRKAMQAAYEDVKDLDKCV